MIKNQGRRMKKKRKATMKTVVYETFYCFESYNILIRSQLRIVGNMSVVRQHVCCQVKIIYDSHTRTFVVWRNIFVLSLCFCFKGFMDAGSSVLLMIT